VRLRHNGYEIHYDIAGEGAPLVLIHGVGSSLASWDEIVPRLGAGVRVIRYDTLGHGDSTKPAGPYALSDYVSELRALLDATDVERANIAGYSFGGMIAQAFALAHPDRVDRLAFISAVAARTPEQRAAVVERANQLATGGASQTIGAALERWYTPEFRAAHPELLERQATRVKENDPQGYAAAYRVFAESDLDEALRQIAAPTLIATGEDDIGSTADMARLMHERIPNSRLAIFPGLRHGVLVEAPDLVAELLRDFFTASAGSQ
jgi:(E)-2-((N-methylformamido)methylene)succinate hydrolase